MNQLPISEPQKRKIKELVDQIIVNRGILPDCKNIAAVDGLPAEQLCQLAFKYYKMVYMGESPLDVDSNIRPDQFTNPQPAPNRKISCCIGCDKPLTEEDDQMPVCQSCRSKIKADYDMLKTLMR